MRRKLAVSLSACLVGLLLCAGLALSSGSIVSAEPPPRTPVSATQTAEAANAAPGAAAIALHAPGAPPSAWTVVQWQDGLGGWHDVDGWRGDLDAGQQKVWWVLGKDFDTGPFRWVVYDQRDGNVWAISKSFMLPARANLWVFVEATP
jgi:hypothetical protein